MIRPPENYYQPSYLSRCRRGCVRTISPPFRFTHEKALQGRFICGTVPGESRSDSRSSGRVLRRSGAKEAPLQAFSAGTGF